MNRTMIAVDVAKTVFEVAVSEHPGQVRERHRLSRAGFRQFLAERPLVVLDPRAGAADADVGSVREQFPHAPLFLLTDAQPAR